MNITRAPAPELNDPALPAFRALLRENASDLLQATTPDVLGAETRVLEVAPVQASWRPGRSLTVRYRVRLDEGGSERDESIIAFTAADLPEGSHRLRTEDGGEVALWLPADDPWLPGLRVALDPSAVRELLRTLGVPPAPVHLVLRTYRAGRRAVIEVATGDYRAFLKVVRPSRVNRLHLRHQLLEPLLPVPPMDGWFSDAGILVLGAMDGSSLRASLEAGEPTPEPREIEALLDRLPRIDDSAAATRARATQRSLLGHAALLRRLAPQRGDAIEELCDAIQHGLANVRTEPVPVHGDLHPSQILVRDGSVSALLDIDTVDLGDRVDDWSLLISHLDVSAAEASDAEVTAQVLGYRDRVIDVALRGHAVDEASLRLRVARYVLGQATSPFRGQSSSWPADTEARIDRALLWLDGVPTGAPQPLG